MATTPAFQHFVGPGLLRPLADNWWLLLMRGIAAIAFGILAFAWPGLTLLSLTLLWGAYAIADGVFALGAVVFGHGDTIMPRWWLAIVGIAGLLAGIFAFAEPGMTAFILLLLIASWAIVVGVLQVVGAIQLRKEIHGEWWMILNGLLSIAFGLILFSRPLAGALAVVWIIGWYALFAGCLSIGLAFRLRRLKHGV